MAEKILVVEDDRNLLDTLKYNLQREGYNVVTAMDGEAALEVARREKPALIMLDVMLPGMDGLEVCRILRAEMTVPILMLTARATETDKIVGLEVGADDYLTKPFSVRELLARVRAMLRRVKMNARTEVVADAVRVGDVEIDTLRHTVTRGGSPLVLTPKEYDLLVFLSRNGGIPFSREQLLDRVWGYDYAGDTRTVDVHVRWLRQKIEEDPSSPSHLLTVRGTGYKLEV